jgi:hypothetical protein
MNFSDIAIAKGYINKAQSAKDRGLEFKLSFTFYKRCLLKKKCQYTSILFDWNNPLLKPTLERVDASKGYTSDNVVVVCQIINSLKSTIDDNANPLTIKHLSKMINFINKR